jgi:ArsR family transcriptional regulator
MSKYQHAGIDELCAAFKALANPQRLHIFLRLTKCCGTQTPCVASGDGTPCCVGDLGEDLGVVPSTVSHHIKELRQAGLMHVKRRGKKIECSVNEATVRRLAAFFGDAVAELEGSVAASRPASTGRT